MKLARPKSDPIPLVLRKLGGDRNPSSCITPAFGRALAEAASVCLEQQGHASPTRMDVIGDFGVGAEVDWEEPSDQSRRCWNDDEYATEHGAYGVAVLLVESCGLEVIQRSKKKTGFDFWLGSSDIKGGLFQGLARLEISGIRCGDAATVDSRVRQKLKQTDASDGALPALAVVVEFGRPVTKIVQKCKQ
jgi:hypothetical protein